MPRTNKSDVKDIVDTELNDSSIDAWIEMANDLADDISVNGSINTNRLTRIEKLLSAHFIRLQEPGVETESVKDASFDFTGDFGMDLNMTRYGQAAKRLDTTGTLSQNADSTKATTQALGVDL